MDISFFISTRKMAIYLAAMSASTVLCAAISFAKTLPASGDILISGGVSKKGAPTASAEFYSVAGNTFVPTGAMLSARAGFAAQSVQITPETTVPITFVAGGFNSKIKVSGSSLLIKNTNSRNIETFSESKGNFKKYPAKLDEPRALFASVPFPGNSGNALDGHVLIVGGVSNGAITALGEAIDPTDQEDGTSNLHTSRVFSSATLLNDGTVLVTGGIDDSSGNVTNSAEIFDPADFAYTTLGSTMHSARAGHTATLLANGTVLIVGGVQGSAGSLTAVNSAEVYNPGSQTFTSVGNLHDARAFHGATLLGNGTVLVAGGDDGDLNFSLSGGLTLAWTSGSVLDTAEIYNPGTHTFSCVGGGGSICATSMNAARLFDTETMLGNGAVLLAGGFNGSLQAQSSAELYSGGFSAIGNLNHPRAMHAAVVLP
jgi:hypothetical protein